MVSSTLQAAASAFGKAAHIAKNSENPVHIALVVGITSAEEYKVHKEQLETQLKDLQSLIDQHKDDDYKLRISFVTYGENVDYHGTFDEPSKILEVVEKLGEGIENDHQTYDSKIARSLKLLTEGAKDKKIPAVDGAIVLADVVQTPDDPGSSDTARDRTKNTDTPDNLKISAQAFKAPIVTIHRNGLEGDDISNLLATLSSESRITNCPLPRGSRITFVNNFIEEIEAQKREAESMHAVMGQLYRYDEDQTRENKTTRRWARAATGLSGLAAILAAAGLVCCLKGCPEEGVMTPIVDPVANKPDIVFDQTGRLTFNEVNKPVNFEQDSEVITESFRRQLDELGFYLEDNPDGFDGLVITGHTSTEGDDKYNRDLSRRRADAVVSYLEQNFGIIFPMEAKGAGEDNPIFSDDYTEEGVLVDSGKAAANRRVEIEAVFGQ